MKQTTPSVQSARLLLYPQLNPSETIRDSIGRLIPNPLMVNKMSAFGADNSPKYKAVEDPWNKVYYSEKALKPNEIPEGYTNKIQDQIFASFQAHKDGWNKFFEGTYKTPREAESNASVNPQAQQQGSLMSSGSTQLHTTKTVGTGLAASPTINPFGVLDSGLNI